MSQRFRNPANGYIEEVGYGACYGVFFLGGIYLALKGLWSHVFIWLALVAVPGIASGGPLLLLSVPIASICYAIAIQGILEKSYLNKGWVKVTPQASESKDPWASVNTKAEASAPAPASKKCPFCAEEIKFEAIRCKHCQADLTSTSNA